jgi:hypothetical protein
MADLSMPKVDGGQHDRRKDLDRGPFEDILRIFRRSWMSKIAVLTVALIIKEHSM